MAFNKALVFSLLLAATTLGLQAQTQPIEPSEEPETESVGDNSNSGSTNSKFWDRVVLGGNIGAQFGASTYVEVSPVIGYKITDMLTAGVGFSYQYFKYNYNNPLIIDYKATVLGPRIFAQHDLFFNLFAHTEFEHSWVSYDYEDAYYQDYNWDVSAWFVGAGYNMPVSDLGKMQIMVLYDLLNTSNSIYYSPWVIRVGFLTGI